MRSFNRSTPTHMLYLLLIYSCFFLSFFLSLSLSLSLSYQLSRCILSPFLVYHPLYSTHSLTLTHAISSLTTHSPGYRICLSLPMLSPQLWYVEKKVYACSVLISSHHQIEGDDILADADAVPNTVRLHPLSLCLFLHDI